MVDGAEGQAIGPAAAEVSDVNILNEEKDAGDDYSPNITNSIWTLKSSIKVNHTEASGNILLYLAVKPSLIFEF